VQQAIATATDILYRLSGRQWPGECQGTWRPCRTTERCGCGDFHLCNCIGGATIVLPHPRVLSIDAITMDGSSFLDYRFYKPNWLTRTDGERWPCCQDLTLDTTEDGTWSVTYTHGGMPPVGGLTAARVLTAELVKACTADKSCRIPVGAVSVTRRGVTYDMSANEGKTGITEVDLWLNSVNPHGRKKRASIVDPEATRWIADNPPGS
jgi:hypothetical protein